MVIMDALLRIIQKTHCMRLLIRGTDKIRDASSKDGAQNTSNYMKFSPKFSGSLQVHTGYLTFPLKKLL